MNAANVRKISASYAGFLVLYSFFQSARTPEAHELRPLFFYERFRECGALFPQLWNVEGALVFAQLFDDLVLYPANRGSPSRECRASQSPSSICSAGLRLLESYLGLYLYGRRRL